MSTESRDVQPVAADSETAQPASKVHPAPSIVWLLVPVALLALLAYASHH